MMANPPTYRSQIATCPVTVAGSSAAATLRRVAIEAVLFDIGGVLEHNPRTGWEQRWASELGMSLEEFERRLGPMGRAGSLGEITLHGAERRIASVFGLDDAALRQVHGRPLAGVPGDAERGADGVLRVAACGATGRGSCPTASSALVSVSRRRTGSRTCATRSSTRTRWAACKPDPRIYEIALSGSMSRRARRCSSTMCRRNVDGALAVGIQAIRFVDTEQAIQELRTRLEGPQR